MSRTAERELSQDVQTELEVYRRAPEDVSVGVIREAIRTCRERSGLQWTAEECLSYVRDVSGTDLRGSAQASETFIGDIEPDTAITAEVLLEQLAPRVREVRSEIFGGPEAPFAGPEAAAAWIEAEREARKVAGDVPDELVADNVALQERWEQCFGTPVGLRPIQLFLDYWKPFDGGGRVLCTRLPFGSPLLRLKQFTVPASTETGIDEHALVSYVLFGACPGLSRILVGYSIGTPRSRLRRTTITFLNRQVTWKDLKRAYSMIQDFKEKRHSSQRLDAEDWSIFRSIRELGKLPLGDVPQTVWDEIGRKVGMEPDAVRMRVRRMVKVKELAAAALYRVSEKG
jgi:hypothetical protein